MNPKNPDVEYWLELFKRGKTVVKADQVAETLAVWSKDQSRPKSQREEYAEMACALFTHWALTLVQNETPPEQRREAVELAMEIAENRLLTAEGDRLKEYGERQKLLLASTMKKQ